MNSEEEITPQMVLGWYDRQFEKITKSDEKIPFAMYRLYAPYALSDEMRGILAGYLKRTVKKAVQFAIDAGDISMLIALLDNEVITVKNVQPLIEMCSEKNLIEWTAVLLSGTRKA